MTPPNLHVDRESQDYQRLDAKLDQILDILHGDGKQEIGMVQKVNLLWMLVFKGPLYVASIVLGAILTIVVQWLTK